MYIIGTQQNGKQYFRPLLLANWSEDIFNNHLFANKPYASNKNRWRLPWLYTSFVVAEPASEVSYSYRIVEWDKDTIFPLIILQFWI